jgi:putative membrane protein
MSGMLIRLAIHVVSLLVVFYFIWNVHSGFFVAAVIMALILALVNAVIKPIVLILTLPISILTLGLFVIVINILLFALSFAVLNAFGYHFDISFGRIALGWLVYVVISTVLTRVI